MGKINFLQVAAMLVLVVTLASCGLTQPGYGDEGYSDRPVRSRSIYSDPYYSNAPTIVRDPYTGRYYEVTPVSPYGYSYDPYYSNNSRYPRRSTSRSSGYSTNYPRRTQSSEQTQTQNRGSETINKAKDIIRGNR